MNEDLYIALCNSCDKILLASDASIERIATPWLHVIRAHPIFLENYLGLLEPHTASSLMRYARNFGSALRHLNMALAVGDRPWTTVGNLPQQCDVLMVSHLVSKDFIQQKGDFYYDRTAGMLSELGITAAIALVNYTDETPAILARNWREAIIPRIIFEPALNIWDELRLYQRLYAEARRIRAAAVEQTNDFDRRVNARAAIEVVSGGAASALRIGEQIKSLVSRLKPRAIVVTYEGHSWERVAFAAARAASPGIRCIGYQHAALFNLQHALQRNLAEKFNPDVILTSGHIAEAKLRLNPCLQNVRIETLGSNRSLTRRTDLEWKITKKDKRSCLVLPEGIVSECNVLFGFALECARAMPEIEFIWRLHPNMTYVELISQNPAFSDLPPNITLSADTLLHDIRRSYWALYRGSTAIIQAAMSGVRPIYLHRVGEIPIDTLYQCPELHSHVLNPDDFKKLVTLGTDDGIMTNLLQDYCEQIFTPLDIHKLITCINGT